MRPGLIRLAASLLSVLMLGKPSQVQITDIPEPPAYIMHAGGVMPDGRIGTNSIEAMNASYEDGNYFIELDFVKTSDGKWVCVHDWDAFYSERITGAKIPDMQTFEMYRKSAYGYESPTLEVLTEWMDEHPEAVIITDVKDDNPGFVKYVGENYPLMTERFIIQIYNRDEYKIAADSGFQNIIYTFYRESVQNRYDTEVLNSFVQDSEKLIALTYADDRANADKIAEVCELGIPVYIHTVNDPKDRLFWKELGVYGFYCDYVADAAG